MRLLPRLLFLLFFSITANAYKPEPEYWTRPDSLGLKYMEKRLITPDKAELLSWILPTQVTKPLRKTLVVAYPVTGNMSNSLYYAKEFLQAGFDVVLFDYRGFGHSSKFDINPNQLYYNESTNDLQTALRAAKTQFPKNKVGVLSFSVSTILATLVAQKEPIDFLIGDGYVTNPYSILSYWKREEGKTLLLPTQQSDYLKAVYSLKCPVLLIAGTKDPITTLESIKTMVGKHRNRTILTYAGDHLEAMQVWKEKGFADGYVKRITKFVAAL